MPWINGKYDKLLHIVILVKAERGCNVHFLGTCGVLGGFQLELFFVASKVGKSGYAAFFIQS